MYAELLGEVNTPVRYSSGQRKAGMLLAVFALSFLAFSGLRHSDDRESSGFLATDAGVHRQLTAGEPNRPIVGILSLALSNEFKKVHHMNVSADVRAVIPASYVKWLESAGAQVVVIPHFWEHSRIAELVDKLSGVLFTGGDYGDADWNTTTAWIYNEVLRRHGTDNELALWGTCLGYERILQVASNDDKNTVVVATLLDESITVEWSLTESNQKTSPFLSFMGETNLNRFADHPIAYNYHTYGVTPESWQAHAEILDPLFDILGMHHNGDTSFVAMIEGKNGLPMWGVQFHPEKALFEWSPNLHYPHSETAVLANRRIADFFIKQIRRINKESSGKGFANFGDESKYAIYNYQAVFTGIDVNATASVFTETYIIDK